MEDKSFVVVTTTINKPTLLAQYALDAQRFNRHIEKFVVIGDHKTPKETSSYCHLLSDQFGIRFDYFGVQDQLEYLEEHTPFRDFLPWNCIQRRNVGLIAAYRSNADIVVTMDDDNYICQPDYFGHHLHLGETRTLEVVRSQTGWWNVCNLLEEETGKEFFHRGYPLSARYDRGALYTGHACTKGRAVVNAGLWLDDPDVDALTRLNGPVNAIGVVPGFGGQIGCDLGTWSPFNSQNTALLREVIPAYLLFPYIGRYDDIWASYVVRHIADYLGDYVTYGYPIVRQKRNPHDYLNDLDDELFGMRWTDMFVECLSTIPLTEDSYKGCFREIGQQFVEAMESKCLEREDLPNLFSKVSAGFTHWTNVFKQLPEN